MPSTFRSRLTRLLALTLVVGPAALLGVGVPQSTAAGVTDSTAAAPALVAPRRKQARDLQPLVDALRERRTAPVRLVFLGSSTTQGLGASDPSLSYANQVVTRLSRLRPTFGAPGSTVALGAAATATRGIEGFNGGRGGTVASNYLDDAGLGALAATAPACVFHMVGSNDAVLGVAPADYETNLRATLDRIDAAVPSPVCHVLVHTFRRGPVTAERWAEYEAAMERVEAGHPHAFMVDASKAFERRGTPGADPLGLISRDDVHPSDRGHALLASTVTRRVASRLARLW